MPPHPRPGSSPSPCSGSRREAPLLLLWAAPPLALQRLVAGDVLAARRAVRLRTALPVALWLAAADRLALADGIWAISPTRSTGLTVLGLPVEEALFFALTSLLVADGLLLATDRAVLARVCRGLRRAFLARQAAPAVVRTRVTTGPAARRTVGA